MKERIIDFSENGAKLRIRNKQLVIEINANGTETKKSAIPVEDIAVILLTHPMISLSKSLLEEFGESGGIIVVTGRHFLPVGMYIPIVGHHLQTAHMRSQAAASVPLRKRVWQKIIQAKIRAQGEVLKEFTENDGGLSLIAEKVKSGDKDHREAEAARRYWAHLFGNTHFRRDPGNGDLRNICLNYGYAVLRSVTARAVCAAGLHPALGIFHHNQYDPFCLADDLMEPFRPIIDRTVALLYHNGMNLELNKTVKKLLIDAVCGKYIHEKQKKSLFNIISSLTCSLADLYMSPKNHGPFFDFRISSTNLNRKEQCDVADCYV
ncbi:MAG: type II CRISPR-associated endonuclease Cas1 [Planctomycetia bacterium]|nr:type II CRISPR-associated endonuclease Cas1 [Planctomycetia bacterium]